jgi:hypothetical protein
MLRDLSKFTERAAKRLDVINFMLAGKDELGVYSDTKRPETALISWMLLSLRDCMVARLAE